MRILANQIQNIATINALLLTLCRRFWVALGWRGQSWAPPSPWPPPPAEGPPPHRRWSPGRRGRRRTRSPRWASQSPRISTGGGRSVFTNEKRGVFTLVSFVRSRFKLYSRKFSKKLVQAPSCERHKTALRTLFLLSANYNCFPITL